MKKLILKDLLLIQKTIFLMVFFVGFFSVLMSLTSGDPLKYSALIILMVYLLHSNVEARNYKTDSDIVIYSLPIKKKSVVISKFINMIIYLGMSIALVFIFSNAWGILDSTRALQRVGVGSVTIAVLFISLYSSIILPVSFKYGYDRLKVVNAVIYVGVFISCFGMLSSRADGHTVANYIMNHVYILSGLASLILGLSMSYSIKTYKEF